MDDHWRAADGGVKIAKKKKIERTDGLGPYEITRLRSAIRQVWHRSKARQLVVKRCLGEDGYSYCEKCKERAPKVFIDHIVNAGDMDEGYIKRMFVPSSELQGLCKKCHDPKTKLERAAKSVSKKVKPVKTTRKKRMVKTTDDFF